MKKTQLKDALRNIHKRMHSYLSVCLVVTLGMIGLVSTSFVRAGLEEKGDQYYREQSFKDFDLISSLGVSEDNLAKIRQVKGVTAVEGVIQQDGVASFGEEKSNVTVISLTEKLSVPNLVKGKLPKAEDECMVGEDFAEEEKIKVGDRIGLSLSGLDVLGNLEPLHAKEFTVTGLMAHPDYLRRKSVNTVTLPMAAYNEEATHGFYTRAFVGLKQPKDISILTDEYLSRIAGVRKKLENLTGQLSGDRLKEMQDEAHKVIDDEWNKAQKKIAEAEKEITDGQKELDEKLSEGEDKLNSAQSTLNSKVASYSQKIAAYEKKIAKGEKDLKKGKKQLADGRKALKEAREAFEDENAWVRQALINTRWLLEKIKEGGWEDRPEFIAKEQQLANWIIDHEKQMRTVVNIANSSTAKWAAKKLKELTNIDFVNIRIMIGGFPVDDAVREAKNVLNGGHFSTWFLGNIEKALQAMQDILDQLDVAEKKLNDLERKIRSGERELAAGRKKVADGKRLMANEKAAAEAKIKSGWNEYYAEKDKYEKKLAEAKALLLTNREEAEKKLAEAREQVDKMKCSWIVLDRDTNAGYVDVRANIKTIHDMGRAFGILFIAISALVCFSTLVIIIDEQKKLVGTAKAFGFHKREVFGKYLTFGVTAAFAGSILGLILSAVLGVILQIALAYSRMYPFGKARSIIQPGLFGVVTLIMIAVTALAAIIACTDVLKTPASILMKGGSHRKSAYAKKKEKRSSRSKGTLYSRLILRNMRDDKARVVITVTVIAFCCMLMGLSIYMKLAYDGMTSRQKTDVYLYDLRMDLGEKVSEDQEKALVEVLKKHEVSYLPATHENMLYSWNDRLDGLQIICADPAKLQDYIAIKDQSTGKDVSIPDDGIIIQHRMHDSYGMDKGDKLPVLDSTLDPKKAEIKGTFLNHVGRMAVTTPAGYKKIFGEEAPVDCYYIHLRGAKTGALKQDLQAVTQDISLETSDDFAKKFETVAWLYDILIAMMMTVAVLISFLILTNMANIFLARKRTELTVMRVNGFSVKQTKGYLTRETIITTVTGLALGVIMGIIISPKLTGALMQPDLEFDRSFHVLPWIIALAVEAVFAVIINTVVFRKVKDLDLKDIS